MKRRGGPSYGRKKRRERQLFVIYAMLALLVLFLLVMAAIWITGGFTKAPPPIETPGTGLASDRPTDESPGQSPTATPQPTPIVEIEVNAGNVTAVLAAMPRPPVYSARVCVEYYWPMRPNGSDHSLQKHDIYMSGGKTKIELLNQAGQVYENTLFDGSTVYQWADGPPVSVNEGFPVTSDAAGYVPSFEKLLALENPDILDASFVIEGNRPFVYVEWRDPTVGYTHKYWVSSEFNMLEKAEVYENGALAYRMAVEGVPTRDEPDASHFVTP